MKRRKGVKKLNELSNKIIGLAIEVHKTLGPGLLESAYKQCLAYELSNANIKFEIEKPIPVVYKNVNIDCAFRSDFIAEKSIILELKSVDKMMPIYEAQLLTYLKLTEIKLGLIINFNVKYLKDGIKRMIL